MTGFFIMSRGFSLAKEAPTAVLMIVGSNREREFSLDFVMTGSMGSGSSGELEVLDDWTEGEHREER
ncbi:MAG TPA: hypothetical protein VGL13_02060, partial [Polyangiaceae bacterium]